MYFPRDTYNIQLTDNDRYQQTAFCNTQSNGCRQQSLLKYGTLYPIRSLELI